MSYDADAAWEKYKLRTADHIMKSSLEGKLDTIAQALNEVLANTERTATILPQLSGDSNAINSAGDSFDPMSGSPGMDMGEEDDYMVGDEDMGAMPEDVGEMPANGEGGTPPMTEPEEDVNKSEDEEMDVAPDAAPDAEDTAASEDDLGGDDLDMPEMGDEENASFADGLDDDVPVDMNDDLVGDIDDEYPVEGESAGDIQGELLDSIKEIAHRAIDEGRMEEVSKLAEVQSTIESLWGGTETGDSLDSFENDNESFDDMEPMEKSIKDLKNKVKGAIREHKNKKVLKKIGESTDKPRGSDYGTLEYDPPEEDDNESDDEDDSEFMEKSCDVKKSDDKIASADAPNMSKDVVTPENSKQKVDHPIDVPTESGRNKGGVAGALDNVTKSADEPLDEVEDGRTIKKSTDGESKYDEGEHEEDYTEYENNNTAPTANTANTASLGLDTQKEHEMALFKSNRSSVPSMKDFMGREDTFESAIDNLRKSSDGLGTELVMKHGMGCAGGIMGIINQQNAIRKAAVPLDEDVGTPEEDIAANEGMGDDINEPIDDVGTPEEDIAEGGDEDLMAISDEEGIDDYDAGGESGSVFDEPLSFEDNEEDVSMDGEIGDDTIEGTDLTDEESNNFKSADSPDMPVEGMENIEASAGNPVVASDETSGAINKSGKHMTSFREMMDSAVMKSAAARPPCTTSVGGDIRRPEFNNIKKSVSSNRKPVRMGFGVNPEEVTASMWDEYNLYKSKPEL